MQISWNWAIGNAFIQTENGNKKRKERTRSETDKVALPSSIQVPADVDGPPLPPPPVDLTMV